MSKEEQSRILAEHKAIFDLITRAMPGHRLHGWNSETDFTTVSSRNITCHWNSDQVAVIRALLEAQP